MKIALGAAQFGLDYGIANHSGRVSQNEIEKILQFSYDAGISYIDTAISYGDSEEKLGLCNLNIFNIVTKIPAISETSNSRGAIFKYIEESLSRLKIDKIYGVLIHDSGFLKKENSRSIWTALQDIKEQGLIDKIGVSLYEPSEYLELKELMDIDLVQFPYNLIDRRFVDSGVAAMMKSKSIEIHTRSVFLQGLLLLPLEVQTKYFPVHLDLWNSLSEITSNNIHLKIDLALSFVSSCKCIDQMIVGVDGLEQIKTLVDIHKNSKIDNWPDINVLDRELINPSNWIKK